MIGKKYKTTKFEESGRLSVAGDSIEYILPGRPQAYCQNWSLSIRDIKVIGEYTDRNGPYIDDYFFVFVLADGTWRQASFYAEDRELFLRALSEKLEYKLECGLCNSTDYKSRVLWPESLKGQNLFTFARAPLTGNFISKTLQKMNPSYLFEFTEPVRKAINL